MFVTGRLAIIVTLGLIPLILLERVGVSPWVSLFGWLVLSIALTTLDVALAASPRQLEVRRAPAPRTRIEQAIDLPLRLVNVGQRRVRGWARDGWQPTAGALPSRHRIDVPAGESRRYATRLKPRRRGKLNSHFVVIRSLGPIGLAGRQRLLPSTGSVLVLPAFRSSRHLASRVARLRELDGNTSLLIRGQGTEFDSLREYVRGDDVRSIDWRATARASTTMLRTWRPERDRHVVILIDSGRTSATRVGDGTRLDAALESTLLLAALAQRAGDHVHVAAFDRVLRARVTGVDGPSLLPTLMASLAEVEPQLIDTDWDAAIEQARALHARPSLLVLLTANESIDASRSFLSLLPGLPNNGTTVLVATTSDIDLAETAIGAHSSDEVHLAAAAEAAIASISAVERAITRAGAEAIADSPNDLPPRVADRYLQLKKLGRL